MHLRFFSLHLSVLFGAVSIFPSEVLAQADRLCRDSKPTVNQHVMFATYGDHTHKWSLEDLPRSDNGHAIPQFSEKGIWVCYGVKPSEPRSGAISVKVARYFSDVPHTVVWLTRNRGFFNGDSSLGNFGPEERVNKNHYIDFHKLNKISSKLQNQFHATWSKSDQATYTAEPESRRTSFLFGKHANDAAARSYLLRYETTTKGSFVPFYIGTGGRNVAQLERVEIIITDLGAKLRDTEIKRVLYLGE